MTLTSRRASAADGRPRAGRATCRPRRAAGQPVARHARKASSASASAQVGLVLLAILLAIAVLAAGHRHPRSGPSRSGIDEGLSQADGEFAPCIHLFGCPEDRPQHFLGHRPQRARRVQPGRLRRARLAPRRLR